MNYVLSVINPYGVNIMKRICEELSLDGCEKRNKKLEYRFGFKL